MATYKTPGVYIEEIPRLPSSVAAVPTSVPVFIGYTEKAFIDGDDWDFGDGPTNPIRIESLLQFETIFGGPLSETFDAVLTGPSVDIVINNTAATGTDFRLYYNMRMYFGNGGSACYIISTGLYDVVMTAGSTDLADAVVKAEQVDEITMVLIPDAMSAVFDEDDHRTINNTILAHCAKMQDRFGILDVRTDTSQTIVEDSDLFRNDAVGANNLSYGAAYYPSFDAAFAFKYADDDVLIDASAVNLPAAVQAYDGFNLEDVNNGIVSVGSISQTGSITDPNLLKINGIAVLTPAAPLATPAALAAAINANIFINQLVVATYPGTGLIVTITSLIPGPSYTILYTGVGTVVPTAMTAGLYPDKALYNRITTELNLFPLELYPSSMMAGIYCNVDSNRGVWKAPANVGVNLVDKLTRTVTAADQSDLNVDATSGKSIDVIRSFPGRGMLVWGARTLDGNSNEWRYISVRRTFLFIEDSCKKATMFSVFEPNDMNTWLRIQGMISSFLTTIWRDGGLAGAKPEDAFFVRVGLGQTMTAQDILEGRLIVQIGLAVVRPAEFIILRFEHMVQTS